MKTWLKGRVPSRVWDNLATLSILGMLAVVALGFYSLQDSRLESCRRTYQSFPLMFRPFFPADEENWSAMEHTNWEKLQRRADDLAGGCSQQIHRFIF